MGTTLRTRLSKKNPYWIPTERRLELVHFCRQYPEWRDESREICSVHGYRWSVRVAQAKADPTADMAVRLEELERKMKLVEDAAMNAVALYTANNELINGEAIILRTSLIHHVTNSGYSYATIGVDSMISEYAYRKIYQSFFWILSAIRG